MKSIVKVGMFGILSVLVFSPLLTGCPGKNSPTAPASTNTPVPPTATPVITNTPTNSPTKTPTAPPSTTATLTPTPTPSSTATNSPTNSATSTPSDTPTVTSTPTHYYSGFVTFGSGQMGQPYGIRFATNGNLWVVNASRADLQNWATVGGSPVTDIGTFPSAAPGYFSIPIAPGVNPVSGDVYVGDRLNYRLVVFNSAGVYQTTYIDGLSSLSGAAFNSAGTTLYALDSSGKCLAVPVTAGSPPTFGSPVTFANSGAGAIGNSFCVSTDSHDNIWIADYTNKLVRKYDPSLVYQSAITTTGTCVDMVVDASDHVYVSDETANDIIEFDASGQQVTTFGGGTLGSPFGVACDSTGHYVYVTDVVNNLVFGFQRIN